MNNVHIHHLHFSAAALASLGWLEVLVPSFQFDVPLRVPVALLPVVVEQFTSIHVARLDDPQKQQCKSATGWVLGRRQ